MILESFSRKSRSEVCQLLSARLRTGVLRQTIRLVNAQIANHPSAAAELKWGGASLTAAVVYDTVTKILLELDVKLDSESFDGLINRFHRLRETGLHEEGANLPLIEELIRRVGNMIVKSLEPGMKVLVTVSPQVISWPGQRTLAIEAIKEILPLLREAAVFTKPSSPDPKTSSISDDEKILAWARLFDGIVRPDGRIEFPNAARLRQFVRCAADHGGPVAPQPTVVPTPVPYVTPMFKDPVNPVWPVVAPDTRPFWLQPWTPNHPWYGTWCVSMSESTSLVSAPASNITGAAQ